MSKVKKSKTIKEESEDDISQEDDLSQDINEDLEDDNINDELDDEDEYIEDENEEEYLDCAINKTMEDEIDFYGDSEIQPEIEEEMVSKENRISPNRLTKYEMVRILGERTKQLKMGAKPLIKNHKDFSYEKIAEEELKTNMIPFKIKRPLPNGKYELWTLDELKKDHLLSLLDE
jgi:DNA-directed RNA polymerase subunit K/omega